MKYLLTSLLFLIATYTTSIQAQAFNANFEEGEAQYIVSFNINADNKLKLESELSRKKVDSDIQEVAMQLLSEKSFATVQLKFNKTHILSTPIISPEAKTRGGFNIPQIAIETEGDFYVDIADNEVYNNTVFKGKKFLVKQDVNEMEWVITDEVRKIGDYTCTKAYVMKKQVKTSGEFREVKAVAWFTDELPLQIAPLNYYGLPGTIVTLNAGGMYYALISVKNKSVTIDYKITPKKAISTKEYLHKKANYYKNK